MKLIVLIAGWMMLSGMPQKSVFPEGLENLPVKELAKKKNWSRVEESITSPEDSLFKCIIENKGVFTKQNGLKVVDEKLSDVLTENIWEYATGVKAYDPLLLTSRFQEMMKADLPEDDLSFTVYDLAKFRGKKEYERMLDLLNSNRAKLGEVRITEFNLTLSDLEELSGTVRKYFIDYLSQQAVLYEKDGRYKAAIDKLSDYKGIVFEEVPLEDVLAKADNAGKLVFVDTYTSWCAPCKMMDKKVFILKEVGVFFNKNFVSTKIDIEKGKGVELAKKFEIKAVPTYLFLDGEGRLIYRTSGYQEAEVFMEKIEQNVLSRKKD